jgi:plasmid stabilization system protein ParE
MRSYAFHPAALLEYAEATTFYLRQASPQVAERFVAAVESGVATIVSAPERWRIVHAPGIRRYVFSRFPFVIYYRWEAGQEQVTIYAVMHSSREPGCWKERIAGFGL